MLLASTIGLALGAVHVLSGPDHLAAIAPLASQRSQRAWSVGLRWGLGHSGGVVLVAFAALFVRDLLPIETLSSWSERLVGLSLIALGLWGFYRQMDRGLATDEAPHGRERAAFAFGTLHGLAGSSHLLGVLPAIAQPTRADALGYLTGFALGTIAAMIAFAAAMGWLSSRSEQHGHAWHRGLCSATSAAAVAIGIVWLTV